LDYEDLNKKIFNAELKEAIKREAQNAEIIIISDYVKGVITKELMGCLRSYREKIIIDAKPRNKRLYKGVFLVKPNKHESLEMAKRKNIDSAGGFLRKKLDANILITLGPDGMKLFQKNENKKNLAIPTYAREVFDVSGAGDTVIASIAMALACNASLEEASIIANHAAGITVSKYGTYNVKFSELEKKILGGESKIKSFNEIAVIVNDLKRKGYKIVWTNGCFDLLHEGHVRYLKKAKEKGNYLIVGVNSDASIRQIKGPGRPVRPENARAEILASIEFVDAVIIFPEINVLRYLNAFQPEVYAKGADYSLKSIDQKEKSVVESYNGKIVFIDTGKKVSTSSILKQIKK